MSGLLEFHPWSSEPQVGVLLNALIEIHECKEVLELGVFMGATSLYLLSNEINYTGIDIEDNRGEIVTEAMNEHSFYIGNTLDIIPLLPSNKYDLIFIDSLHTFAHLLAEFKLCERIIKNHGLFVFHDSLLIPDVAAVIAYIKSFPHFEILTLNTPDIPGRGGASGITIVRPHYV